MEIVCGILANLSTHRGLAHMLASHAALPQAVVDGGLCGCDDPVALTAACNFLLEACGESTYVTKRVRDSPGSSSPTWTVQQM